MNENRLCGDDEEDDAMVLKLLDAATTPPDHHPEASYILQEIQEFDRYQETWRHSRRPRGGGSGKEMTRARMREEIRQSNMKSKKRKG